MPSDHTRNLLAVRIASFFRETDEMLACFCIDNPSCFNLGCDLVWRNLLSKPEILTNALDLYSAANNILMDD